VELCLDTPSCPESPHPPENLCYSKRVSRKDQVPPGKFRRCLWEGIVAGLTVLGGFVSALTLWPRITITTAFEPSHPLETSFLISNDGYLPAYSVSVSCLIGEVDATPQTGDDLSVSTNIGALGSTIYKPVYVPNVKLDPGTKELVPMSDCASTETADVLNSAHLGLHVTYRPLLWPWKREFTQEFYVKKIHKGTFKMFVWYSVPYNK
jgi:hypothetical protein